MTYTDTQLKQALAKMLPEQVAIHACGKPYWINSANGFILDTELLHLCWMVEETFEDEEESHYINSMYDNERNHLWTIHPDCHASWQHRVIALAKVKGIEL